VGMPETAVNKYRLPEFWQYDVRFARQVFAMQPKPIAHRMQKSPNRHFGAGVLAPY
jgi:hypothetical protein